MVRATLPVLLLVMAGCGLAIAKDGAESLPEGCPAAYAELAPLLGTWSQSIVANEGWPGEGESTMAFEGGFGCVVEERGSFTLFTDEGPIVSSSANRIAYDVLSDRWKLLSTDSRGFTHIGIGGPTKKNDWAFDIVRETGEPGRRIAYRGISDTGFQWIWQGQDDTGTWLDRLVISYEPADQ